MIEEEKPSDISSTESPAPEPIPMEDTPQIKLSRLLIHFHAIGVACNTLFQGARATGASGLQTLVRSDDLLKLAQTVGAAGMAFKEDLKTKT